MSSLDDIQVFDGDFDVSSVQQPVLFAGRVASGTTRYVRVPIHNGAIGAQIAWKDATSSATITLELSSFPNAAVDDASATAASQWKGSGVTITGPAATAIDSTLINVENVRQVQARLKIVAAADSVFEILDGITS
jgi:hypothetical protein